MSITIKFASGSLDVYEEGWMALVWIVYKDRQPEDTPCYKIVSGHSGAVDKRRLSGEECIHPTSYKVTFEHVEFNCLYREDASPTHIAFALYQTMDPIHDTHTLIGAGRHLLKNTDNEERLNVENNAYTYYLQAFCKNSLVSVESPFKYSFSASNLPDSLKVTSDSFDSRLKTLKDKYTKECEKEYASMMNRGEVTTLIRVSECETNVALLFETIPRFMYYTDTDKKLRLSDSWIESVVEHSLSLYVPDIKVRQDDDDLFVTAIVQGIVNYVNTFNYVHDTFKKNKRDNVTEEFGGHKMIYTGSFDCEDGSWFLMACVKAIQSYKGINKETRRASDLLSEYVPGTMIVMTCDRNFFPSTVPDSEAYDPRETASECHALGVLIPKHCFFTLLGNSPGYEKFKSVIEDAKGMFRPDLKFRFLESTSNTFNSIEDIPFDPAYSKICRDITQYASEFATCVVTRSNITEWKNLGAQYSYFDFTTFDCTLLYDMVKSGVLPSNFPVRTEFILHKNEDCGECQFTDIVSEEAISANRIGFHFKQPELNGYIKSVLDLDVFRFEPPCSIMDKRIEFDKDNESFSSVASKYQPFFTTMIVRHADVDKVKDILTKNFGLKRTQHVTVRPYPLVTDMFILRITVF